MANALRVNALELLRRPGTERILDVTTEVDELGIDDPRYAPHTPVRAELRLESLTDGIVVHGTLTTRWQGVCRRCAVPATGELVSKVDELYQQVPTDPDAFELGDQLDLVPMVRELLVLDAPYSPLCKDDCAGLCPNCGIDRNLDTCSCRGDTSDERWAALRDWQDRPLT
jgi:uncharacterized protein